MRVNYNICQLLSSFVFARKGNLKRKETEAFFSDYYGTRPVKLTSSGRSAIYFILKSLPQKKVYIPAYTCSVVIEAAKFAGKEVCYAPTDIKTYNADHFEDVDNDSIVIATHQYGLACDIVRIANKCKENGAILLEDCAQSLGTTVRGQLTGTFGDYAVVSFNSSKLLTLPDSGGLIIAKNENLMAKLTPLLDSLENPTFKQNIVMLRHGIQNCLLNNGIVARLYHYWFAERYSKMQPYEHNELSDNKDYTYYLRMPEWKYALLLQQTKQLDQIINRKRYIFDFYDRVLNNSEVVKPLCMSDAVCCRYTIRVKDRRFFYEKCLKSGIGLEYSHKFIAAPNEFKYEHQMADEIVNLPFYYRLRDSELKNIIKTINAFKR